MMSPALSKPLRFVVFAQRGLNLHIPGHEIPSNILNMRQRICKQNTGTLAYRLRDILFHLRLPKAFKEPK